MFAGSAAPGAVAAVQDDLPMVLVAKQALPVGTIITPDMLSLQPWPQELVKDAYFIQTPEAPLDMGTMAGRVVRFAVTAGEPVTQGALVAPGDRGFLAAALSPGMRAVTIAVSGPTAVGGFVFPGDRIDLVLTQKISGIEGPELKTSETIARNLRVLATNQSAETEKDEAGKPVVKSDISLITVEATPRIAEKINVAQSIGTVSVSLRSLADTEGDVDAMIASGEIKIPAGLTPAQEAAYLQKLRGRPVDERGSFVTGADVSRFQRSTMPLQTQPKQEPNRPAPAPASAPAPARASSEPRAQAAAPAKPDGPSVRVKRGSEEEIVVKF